VTAPVAREVPPPNTTRNSRDLTCFKCGKKGHKSPECPSRPRGNRRVQDITRTPVPLNDEEIFGSLNGCDLPVTIDTGAQISIVPMECVLKEQMVGRKMTVRGFQGSIIEGEACIVNFKFKNRAFEREAVAVPGKVVNWTPCLQVSLSEGDDLDFLRDLARQKMTSEIKPTCVRPVMDRGKLLPGYMVSASGGGER